MDKPLWKRKHRTTGVAFEVLAPGDMYLSFNWNGTHVWEWIGSPGHRTAKSFAKLLREAADRLEQSGSEGDQHG